MSASTTRLSLTKPGGGSTGLITPPDIVDIDVLNANFDKIDAAIGAQVVTSTTLPSVPFTGEFVFETDTKRIRVFSGGQFVAPATERGSLTMYTGTGLSQLDAITDAVYGDTFYMTDPGLGNAGTGTIDPITWEAFGDSGVNMNWRIRDRIVTDTKAHLDSFIAAVAAIAGTDEQFRVGNEALLTVSQATFRFTSTAGAYLPLKMVRPSSAAAAANGTATINDDGSVTFVTTAASNVILNNIFPPTAIYDTDNFDVELSYVGATSTMLARLCVGGVVDPSAANHDYSGTTYTQAGVVSPTTSLNAANWPLNAAITGVAHEATLEVRHAGVAAVTRAFVTSRVAGTLGTAENGMRGDLGHRLSTVFDGLQIALTGAGTLTIKVKPRA